MSNWIFPSSLPLLKMGIKRSPVSQTEVLESAGGKEWRATWWTAPRWRYSLGFEALRGAASLAEVQRVLAHVLGHAGSLDSFLLLDPEDSVVADQGIGVGDGVTTAFQLQRTAAGQRVGKDGLSYAVPTKRRTNLCPISRFEIGSAWTPAGPSPDGSYTAARHTKLTSGANEMLAFNLGTWGCQIGRTYTWSMSLKAENSAALSFGHFWNAWPACTARIVSGPGTLIGGTGNGTQASTYNAGTPAGIQGLSTTAWTRVEVTSVCTNVAGYLAWYVNGTGPSAIGGSLLMADSMFEEGAVGTPTIPTTAAAASATPAYYPALGDGFEPVWEPAPGEAITVRDPALGTSLLRPYARTLHVGASFDTWSIFEVTRTTGQTAPDGTSTAALFTATATASADHAIQSSAGLSGNPTAGLPFVFSFYAKAGTHGHVYARSSASARYAWFNLTTGTVGSATGCTAGIEPLPGGWFRCWIAGTNYNGSLTLVGLASAAGAQTFSGAGTETVTLWGPMFETVPVGQTTPGRYASAVAADYTLGANGLVTLTAAPAVNAQVAWSGSHYRRVRLAAEQVDMERILSGYWQTAEIPLLTVKP